MKNLLLVVSILAVLVTVRSYGFSGCKAPVPVCSAITSISTSISAALSGACGCNQTAVYNTIFNDLNFASMCTVASSVGGPISSALCPIAWNLISADVSKLAAQTAWACTAITSPSCLGNLNAAAISSCELIPIEPKDLKM